MSLRALLLATVLGVLALSCSEDASLPPLEENPPPFSFDQYFEGGKGKLLPKADQLLVRRPKHLEHVYELTLNRDAQGHAQAHRLFDIVEDQFTQAGEFVANHVFSLRCAAVELPDCVPKWGFIDELLGPGDGPGAIRLRQVLAGSFEERARQLQMENTLVLATVNVLLTRGMLKSALSNAAMAEARAALAEQRAAVEGPGGKLLRRDSRWREPLLPQPSQHQQRPLLRRAHFRHRQGWSRRLRARTRRPDGCWAAPASGCRRQPQGAQASSTTAVPSAPARARTRSSRRTSGTCGTWVPKTSG